MASIRDLIGRPQTAPERAAELHARAAGVPYAALVAQVDALTREVADLTAALAKLQAPASTVGPVPATPADAKSGRSLIRYIAAHLGRNEDGIRKALTSAPAFADLREKAPDLCTNLAVMRWLAGEHNGQLRFTWIASGAHTCASLVAEEAGA